MIKKIILIPFLLICFCQGVIAQNNAKIDVALQQEMSFRNTNELIGINIILKQQYDQIEMRQKSSAFTNKEDKRNFVISELKRFSGETQREVINYLKVLSENNQVSNIQSHWIYNGIFCYVSKIIIEELITFDDILIIGFDKQYKFVPEDMKNEVIDRSREITYNVLKVNADKVWNLGFTGEGVIVAVADCGVNYNHYDLKDHMWEHPNFPYHGWNFVFNNNDPMDLEGHGTHCAGTIAGNGTAGSQTGMAPDATIMALKVWDDSQGLGGANTMSSGFEFAVEYGAHIISMSGGVPQMLITDADKILLRNTMVNVLEAGVIASVAAGNEGNHSPPNSVRCPSSCPPPWLHPDQITIGGKSCVMSVGATDINDSIAGFSSKGPVTWQSILGYSDYPYNPGMGLIRPDVCAPGVDIKSLSYNNNSGYVSGWSGTSMATPCVAGVMALMLSSNINLTPAEICEILETTAMSLPNQSSPKGNIFGSGRINAYNAVLAARCLSNLPIVQGTIVQNTIWNTPVYAIQTVTIPNEVTLTITNLVKCSNDFSILIQPGGKLILDGGTLTNACENEMWQGITVMGDINIVDQGCIEIKNGGQIENAICGITALQGGRVSAKNANFVNNTIGVTFDPLLSGQIVQSGSFQESNFVLDNNYFGNLSDFETHIKMQNSGMVRINGCNFSSTALKNNATKNYGITSFNSPLIISEHCLDTVLSPVNKCSNGIPTIFNGFYCAVSAGNSGTSPTTKISYNSYTNNLYGVNIAGINYHELLGNDFHLSNSFGVVVNGATGYKIEENNFFGNTAALKRAVGLNISNSGIDENEVYKNFYDSLFVAQQFTGINATQSGFGINPTGLQTVCNTFQNNSYSDIWVGVLPGGAGPSTNVIKKQQGSISLSARNLFYGTPVLNISNSQSQYAMDYYYDPLIVNEYPIQTSNVITHDARSNSCPSKIYSLPRNREDGSFGFENALAQYDEWNEQYEYYLALLKSTEQGSEEYYEILDQVSYYSALKDNYFNWIIAETMNDVRGMRYGVSGDDEVSGMRYEVSGGKGVDGEAGRGSLYETLRFLFSYRNHYTDNLSIAETYMAEHNYEEALATIAQIYAQFEITSEQVDELVGLQTYIRWLLQLENNQKSIYSLAENEIQYLVNFVETNIGRGRVFANNILCGLYGICLDEVGGERYEVSGDDEVSGDGKKSPSNFEGVDGEAGRGSLNDITLIPNPTTGELRVTSYELQVTGIEVFDVYGKNVGANLRVRPDENKIDISDLASGVYFVKIFTNAGVVTKKVIKN